MSATARPKEKYRKALSWSVAMIAGQQGLAAIVAFLLAAILGPSAFGTVAMASVYVLFMQMLLQQAIPAIVQREQLDDEHLDSAFWLVFFGTCCITVISVALAGPWAAANRTPDLQPIIIALSVQVPLQGLVVVQEALLRRTMDFKSLAIRSLTASIVGGVVGIGLALGGAGVWALVWQAVANSVAGCVMLWKVSEWRPHWRFSKRHARDLVGFSIGSSLASLAAFVNVRSDPLLIGLFFGAYAVGLYRLASRFTEIFVDFLTRSMQQVAFPELSRLQTDPPAFARRLRDILKQSSIMTLPSLGILAGCADQLLRFFGPEWKGASIALQLLCVSAAIKALTLMSSAGLQAIGKPQVLAWLSWVAAGVSAGSFVVVGLLLRDQPVQDQVVSMAASRGVVYVFVLGPLFVYVIRKYCGLSARRLFSAVTPPSLSGGAGALAGILWTSTGIDQHWSPVVALAVTGTLSLAAAGAVLVFVARAEVVRLAGLVGRVLTKPGWSPGYRPRHIQAALVDQVLITSATDLVDYEPRHLATSSRRTRIPRGGGANGAAVAAYTSAVQHSPVPEARPVSARAAAQDSGRPGGWSQVNDSHRLDLLRGALNVDLWTSLGIMVRRWTVTVPILVVTAIASLVGGTMIAPDYEASTTLLLLGPGGNSSTDASGGSTTTAPTTTTTAAVAGAAVQDLTPNPLIAMNDSLISTARAEAEAIKDDSVSRRLHEAGLSTNYELTVAVHDPIMQIKVTDADPDQVSETLAALHSTVTADLQARQDQAGAAQNDRIQIQTLAETNQPKAIYGGRRRAQLVIVALGIILSAVGAFAAEGIAQRRKRDRDGESGGARHASNGDGEDDRYGGFYGDSGRDYETAGRREHARSGPAAQAEYGAGRSGGSVTTRSTETQYGDDGHVNGDRWR